MPASTTDPWRQHPQRRARSRGAAPARATPGRGSFPTDDAHHLVLWDWATSFGQLTQAGVECTGCFGYRLAQYLTGRGVTVFEVNRPNRTTRRRRGKSDPVDAENAARAVLAGDATAVPKTRTGPDGQLRALLAARRSAIKSHTQADCSYAVSSSNSTTEPAPASTASASPTWPPPAPAGPAPRHQHRPGRAGPPLAAPRRRSPRQ